MAQAPIAEFERIANRAKRELMARVPPVGWAVDMRYERRLRHHAGQLAPLSATHTELVSRLRREGAIVTTSTSSDSRAFRPSKNHSAPLPLGWPTTMRPTGWAETI